MSRPPRRGCFSEALEASEGESDSIVGGIRPLAHPHCGAAPQTNLVGVSGSVETLIS